MVNGHGFWVGDEAVECGAEVEVRGGIATVSWWGTLTDRRMPILSARAHQLVRSPPAVLGVVMDFTGSLLLAGDESIADSLAEPAHLGHWCPVAIVAGMQINRFDSYQTRAALVGPVTDVFAGRETATRWLREQMYVHREMQARQQRLRVSRTASVGASGSSKPRA